MKQWFIENQTLAIILVVWFIGVVVAWCCIKKWQGEDFKWTLGHVLGNLCMSCASWGLWILWLIHYLHNKKW